MGCRVDLNKIYRSSSHVFFSLLLPGNRKIQKKLIAQALQAFEYHSKPLRCYNNQIFNNSTRIILDCYHKIFRKFRKEILEKCHILNILWEDFDLEEYNEYISLFDQVVEISSPQQIENQENIPNLEDQNQEQEIK